MLRRWGKGPVLLFLLLNPSTADHKKDDPTIRKCIGFAKLLGYSAIRVVNLFAYRATDPKDMLAAADAIGPKNDYWLMRKASQADLVICGWGAKVSKTGRPKQVMKMLKTAKVKTFCLLVTKDGSPGHPLYIPYDTPLKPYVV